MRDRALYSEGFARDVAEQVPEHAAAVILTTLDLLESSPKSGIAAAGSHGELRILPAGLFDVVYSYNEEAREARVMGLVMRP